MRPHTDNILHGSGTVAEKISILLQIKKAAESSDGDLIRHLCSVEDAAAHLATSDPNVLMGFKPLKSRLEDRLVT